MPIYNAYTNTNDYPFFTDYPLLKEIGLVANPMDLKFKQNPITNPTGDLFSKWSEERAKYINDQLAWLKKYNIDPATYNAWVKANQKAGEDEKTFFERMKKAAQTVIDPVKTAINTVKDSATDATKLAKITALMLLFKPLIPVANSFLKKKGITPSSNPYELVKQVYNEKSRAGFGFSASAVDVFDYVGQKGTGYFEKFGFGPGDISPEMISAVLPFLTAILEALKIKKANNQPLTPEEEELAKKAKEISDELDRAKREAENTENGSFFQSNWKKILAVVLLIVLFLFLAKKAK
jgi:hypothetical protein